MGGESAWGGTDAGGELGGAAGAAGSLGGAAGSLGRTLTLDGGGGLVHVSPSPSGVSLADSFAQTRHIYMLSMPKTADNTRFVISARSEGGVRNISQDWVYGHHVTSAVKNADGSYNVAGRSLNEHQFNNLRARLSDVRDRYDRSMSIWEAGAAAKGYI